MGIRFRIALVSVLLFAALATPTQAATFQIQQVGTTWVPDDLTIEVGDTVEFVWSSGAHTATSGTGAGDPNVGDLFDEPLTSGNPVVSYTYTMVGDFPFFCRPHEFLNMTGVVHVEQPTGIGTPSQIALDATLYAARPNPFNPRTTIRFDLNRPADVSLKVFDVTGRLVRVLLDREARAEGIHSQIWDGRGDDGRGAPSGVYFYRLEAAGTALSDRMVLTR